MKNKKINIIKKTLVLLGFISIAFILNIKTSSAAAVPACCYEIKNQTLERQEAFPAVGLTESACVASGRIWDVRGCVIVAAEYATSFVVPTSTTTTQPAATSTTTPTAPAATTVVTGEYGTTTLTPSSTAIPGGLVPCGNGPNDPCTLCHFVIGFQSLIKFMLELVVTVGFVGIFASGVLYIISAGDEKLMGSAKSALAASLIGFAIVLGAWLIVNVTLWAFSAKLDMRTGGNWYTLECSTKNPTMIINTTNTVNTTTPVVTTSDPICGINGIGECKAGVIIGTCPDGWSAVTGNPSNPCVSGTKCCAKDGESTETCGLFTSGTCFYGMSICPPGHSHVIGICTASTSICCQ
jgi:hypothetical protein